MGGSEREKCAGRAERRRALINVNLETIIILCNWIDGLNSAKAAQTATF